MWFSWSSRAHRRRRPSCRIGEAAPRSMVVSPIVSSTAVRKTGLRSWPCRLFRIFGEASVVALGRLWSLPNLKMRKLKEWNVWEALNPLRTAPLLILDDYLSSCCGIFDYAFLWVLNHFVGSQIRKTFCTEGHLVHICIGNFFTDLIWSIFVLSICSHGFLFCFSQSKTG